MKLWTLAVYTVICTVPLNTMKKNHVNGFITKDLSIRYCVMTYITYRSRNPSPETSYSCQLCSAKHNLLILKSFEDLERHLW